MIAFFNIDTQRDFMNADGALRVPGSEKIRSNLKLLTEFAASHDIQIVSTLDMHDNNDPELRRNGGKFPDHCMRGSYGSRNIQETTVDKKHFNIFIEKNSFDMFTNPQSESVVKTIDFAVVYGVATEYCVKAAVLGLLARGIRVVVAKDAIAGIDAEASELALDKMKSKGAMIETTSSTMSNLLTIIEEI